MMGSRSGHLPSQGLIVSGLLQCEGYNVTRVSHRVNRYIRLLDIAQLLLRNSKQFDVIILDVFGGRSIVIELVASTIARIARVPLIAILRGGNLPSFSKQYPGLIKRVLNNANIVVAPSKFLSSQMCHYYHSEIRIIPNILDPKNYPYRHRSTVDPVLFWMRSFHEIYNPQMALSVVSLLRNTYPNVRLLMAGTDNGLLNDCTALARQLNLDSNVHFLGFLDTVGKQKVASEADIFINTNRVDNMPVSLVEAAAFGIPIVATDVGGIPYLFTHEEDALLVPNEDVSMMAQQVQRLIETPSLVSKLSQNGRLLAERSFWPNVVPVWNQMLQEIKG